MALTPSSCLPQINGSRLWSAIMLTSQFGGLKQPVGAMQRLSLSDSDKQVRDWFVKQAADLGCDVKVDAAGNIFAVWIGNGSQILQPGPQPIGMGSHLDTQPLGGRFDGILGVLSALEVIRTVKENGLILNRPLAAINWTNEEGSRFPVMCSGSSVWSGEKALPDLHALGSLTEDHVTFKDELSRISYMGGLPCSHTSNPLAAHFELHIEQAARLEMSSRQIGIVTGVQGMRWLDVCITGSEGHAGSTSMSDRRDALAAASQLILFVEQEATRVQGFGTVGFLKPRTESPNTIVGEVSLMIDIRHPSDNILDELETSFQALLASMARTRNITSTLRRTWSSPAVEFDEKAVACVQKAAQDLAPGSSMSLISLAGHDSAETARVTPTAMIFVPSRDGVSHCPEEYTSEEHCALGAQALLQSVLEYDRLLGLEDKERSERSESRL